MYCTSLYKCTCTYNVHAIKCYYDVKNVPLLHYYCSKSHVTLNFAFLPENAFCYYYSESNVTLLYYTTLSHNTPLQMLNVITLRCKQARNYTPLQSIYKRFKTAMQANALYFNNLHDTTHIALLFYLICTAWIYRLWISFKNI